MKKGFVEIGAVVTLGVVLVLIGVFYGMLVPSILNTGIRDVGTAYTNESFTANATYAANGTGNWTYRLLTYTPIASGSEAVGNATFSSQCPMTRNTNYTLDYTTGALNLTVYNTSKCGTIWGVNYTKLTVNSGNWSSYSTAAATVNLTPTFAAILFLIMMAGVGVAFMKLVGIM